VGSSASVKTHIPNLINGIMYVGSTRDLRRFQVYFNTNYLKRNNSLRICLSLMKHGYSNFTRRPGATEILEYCDPDKLLEREKYYFELLKPEYNICKEPASPILGRNHSEEAPFPPGGDFVPGGASPRRVAPRRGKISASMLGRKDSEQTRAKKSESQMGNSNSRNQP
jgi:group I intron endonuclease